MASASPEEPEARPRRPAVLALLAVLAAAMVAGLLSLGFWQIERLGWKRDLKARIAARVHAEPVAPPGPAEWDDIAGREYLRVRLSGRFDHGAESFVQAVTGQGGGFWLMTPLITDRGFTVLVNRGFLLPERRDPATRQAAQAPGIVSVTGLLRLSEPKGGFLRDNDPQAGRWFSRDVAEIAQAKGIADAAPYFVDADATPNPGGVPQGGLTVLSFPDNHLGYALTWFALAAMVAGAAFYVGHGEWRLRRARRSRSRA